MITETLSIFKERNQHKRDEYLTRLMINIGWLNPLQLMIKTQFYFYKKDTFDQRNQKNIYSFVYIIIIELKLSP